MALINRVSRLFRADLHAVLDRIEEPDVLLRQAVREMEEALAGDERQAKILQHELGQFDSRTQDIEQKLAEIANELEVCFDAGKDDLARVLIRRRLEAQRYQKFLSRKRVTLIDSIDTLNARLDEQRTQLDSMRQKAELLVADNNAENREDFWTTPDFTVRDEEVEVAFLGALQARRQS